MPTLAARLSTPTPSTGLMPSSTAPAAPANPMCEIACAAKLDARSTTKYPIRPATRAEAVAAANALRMKAKLSMFCTSATRFQLGPDRNS